MILPAGAGRGQALDPNLDYQDVKLKIVQQEGYDAHDFNLFDDRSSQLWRKPYVDGAVRELTSGESRSQEQIRQAVEQMMIAARPGPFPPSAHKIPRADGRKERHRPGSPYKEKLACGGELVPFARLALSDPGFEDRRLAASAPRWNPCGDRPENVSESGSGGS